MHCVLAILEKLLHRLDFVGEKLFHIALDFVGLVHTSEVNF